MGKKAKQEELPGLEARDVPEIEQAAEHYRRIRDERCELSKREAEAKSALIQVMKNLGRSFYQYNGLKVQLEITDNVKVKSSDDGDEEPIGTFRQPAMRKSKRQQQGSKQVDEAERERLHREAVANWRRERPASSEVIDEDDETNYWDEWRAGLSAEEREKHDSAPCRCGHPRNFHEGDNSTGECTALNCGPTNPIPRCLGYHCPACDTKGGHQATCEHYLLGEGTPIQKEEKADFTAERCDECKMIEGGHAPKCSKSDSLTFEDYEAYAKAHYKTNHKSHARKMEVSKLNDHRVREWKQQQAGNGVEPEPKKKTKKLSLVEAAIDR